MTVDAEGLTLGGAGLVAVDVPFNGGLIHIIDRVLLPEHRSIAEVAAEADGLSTLLSAVVAAGLADQLGDDNGPFTVFAPVNAAFGSLPEGVLDTLLRPENRAQLTEVLGLHVVPGTIRARELLTLGRAETYLGESIEFGLADGTLRVGNASIIASDIEAANGVVHLIDAVLLPRALTLPAAQPLSAAQLSANAEAARLCELALARGVALFNHGQHEACASVYEVTLSAIIGFAGPELDAGIIERIEHAMFQARNQHRGIDRAWTYRAAIDEVYPTLNAAASTAGRATAATR